MNAAARILLVEDNRLVRETLSVSLTSLGYQVLTAEDGEAARTILAGPDSIDLVFTDFFLRTGPNGAQIAAFARALRPSIKILFTSGFAADSLRDRDGVAPGDEFLMKPYDLDALRAALGRILG